MDIFWSTFPCYLEPCVYSRKSIIIVTVCVCVCVKATAVPSIRRAVCLLFVCVCVTLASCEGVRRKRQGATAASVCADFSSGKRRAHNPSAYRKRKAARGERTNVCFLCVIVSACRVRVSAVSSFRHPSDSPLTFPPYSAGVVCS